MSRETRSFYSGELAKPIARTRGLGMLSDVVEQNKINTMLKDKIPLLFQHYEIPFDEPWCWRKLALRPVKDVIFRLLETEIRRKADRQAYGSPANMLTPTDAVRQDRVSRHWAASRREWMLQLREMKLPLDHYIHKVDDTLGEHKVLRSMLNRKRHREPVGQ